MRSINYLLFGKPNCFADCIDYLENHALASVKVSLKSYKDKNDDLLITRLSGYFLWNYTDRIVLYEEVFGGIVETEKKERRLVSVRNANRRLERRVRDFEQFKLELIGREMRFSEEDLVP